MYLDHDAQRKKTYVVFPEVSPLTIVFSATNTLVMVLEKAKVITTKCNTTATASPMMWKNAICIVPTPFIVSKMDPKALNVRNIVLNP